MSLPGLFRISCTTTMDALLTSSASWLESTLEPQIAAEPRTLWRPARQLLQETALFNALLVLLLLASWRLRRSLATISRSGAAGYSPAPTAASRVCGALLFVLDATMLCMKLRRGWGSLLNALFPCHPFTAGLVAWCWMPRGRGKDALLGALTALFWQPALALLMPDTTGYLWDEAWLFYVHHYGLVAVTIFIARYNRPASHSTAAVWADVADAISWTLFLSMDVQTFASLCSGTNINYMLWPPFQVPLLATMKWYRVLGFVALSVLSALCRLALVPVGSYVMELVVRGGCCGRRGGRGSKEGNKVD